MRLSIFVRLLLLTALCGCIYAQSIALTVRNIPAAANKVTMVVDGPGIAGKVWTCQPFAVGTGTFSFNTSVPAGGPYRIRAIVFRSVSGETFPAILRSGKSTGVIVASGSVANVSITLADIPIALDAASATSGGAGALVALRVNINDDNEVMAGRTTGRIWYSSTPFSLNMYAAQTFGPMSQPVSGARQAVVDLRLPATAGTLYYQFGESAPDFRNPNNQESPFVVWPDIQQSASLLQLAVTSQTSVSLTVNQIPAAANKVTAVVDGIGLTGRIVSSQSFSAGTASTTLSLGVPAGGPYRIRALAFNSNPGSTSRPAILRSGQVNGVIAGTGVASASITLGDISMLLDGSTPSSGTTGSVVTIAVNVLDSGAVLESATSARIWTDQTAFAQNFGGTAVTGTWASAGAGQWRASVPVTLPGTAGTLYYQLGEAAQDFASVDVQETPYLVWPNVSAGAVLQQINVTLNRYLAVAISNIPTAATRVAVVVDGGGISPRLLATQTIAPGAGSVVLNIGAPQGGPYRARAIAWTSTGATNPAILRTGKALGIQLSGASAAVSISLADVAFSVDSATPATVTPGAAFSVVLNYSDNGDVLEGAPGARIWYASSPLSGNVSGTQASGYLTTAGNGNWQSATDMTAPVTASTLYYQFGESAPGFASGGETPMLIWPNLSTGGQPKQIAVLNGVLVTVSTIPAGLPVVVDGASYTTPQLFSWVQGSSHTLSAAAVQGSGATRNVFSSWSDGGGASHTIAAPGGNATYTATYQTQHLVSTAIVPQIGGGLTLNPASADGFYNMGAVVQVAASAANGFSFQSFSGDLTGSNSPTVLTVNGPRTVTANFTALTPMVVATSPPGLSIVVDSVTYSAPQTFAWTPGSSHTLAVASPQGAGGTRYRFSNWSDGGALSHALTAPASAATYTASFVVQHLLAISASPAAGGTLTAAPPSVDGYYDAGAAVQVSAAAAQGYYFAAFSGDASGASSPASVVMSAPRAVTANFGTPGSATITTSPPGLSITVDGAVYLSPQTFTWTPGGSHSIGVTATQGASGTRYQFSSWSDAGAATHTITAQSGGASYIATFVAEYLLTTTSTPGGGSLAFAPPSVDGYYPSGTAVQVTAAPANGFIFSSFQGDASGATNPATLAMTAPRSLNAVFSATYAITIGTSPAGLSFSVDNATYNAAQTFQWMPGSSHTLGAAVRQGSGTTRHTLSNWSDAGASTHAIITPAINTTYTASYTPQYLLSLSANPSAGGTLAASPASTDGYYDSGTVVQVSASPAAGYTFSSFGGDLAGTGNPASLSMSAPRSVSAAFQAVSQVTIATSPPGMTINVDSTDYIAPRTFNWVAGATHSVAVAARQGGGGTRYVFTAWSDGGAVAHNISAAAGSATFTASFDTQYLLNLTANPASGGTLTALPVSSDSYYSSGTSVQISAGVNSGYVFAGFAGDATGVATSATVAMNGPRSVTANFSATAGVTVTTSPPGLAITVDSVTYSAPRTFTWTAGTTHSISTNAQQGSGATRHVFASWSDNGALAHTITTPATAATFTASFTTQHSLSLAGNPASSGSLSASPSSADGFYNAGTTVQLSAAPAANYTFQFYSGDLGGAANPQSIVMNAPRGVTANFAATEGGGVTNAPPYALELTPFEGAGASQLFVLTFNDNNGWTDVTRAYIRMHESYAGAAGGCVAEFRPGTSQLLLLDDAGTNWLGPVTLGSANGLENAACSLDAAATSFSGTGNTLTVNLAVNFKPGFGSGGGREPRKAVCTWAKDAAGAGEDQSCLGLWIPEAPSPVRIARYRLYNPVNFAHFFTASQNERDVLVSRGFQPEDPPPGMAYNQPNTLAGIPTRPYYRLLFFPQNGAPIFHFWTRDREEYKAAVRQHNVYVGEGIDSFLLSAQTPGTLATYRLRFLPPAPYPIYHYALQQEHDILAAGGGWGSLGADGYLQPMPSASAAAGALTQADRFVPAIASVLNAASYNPGPVAAGQLIHVYGHGFTASTEVLIDGFAAPALARTERCIELVVPESLAGKERFSLSLDDSGQPSEAVSLEIARANPAIFTSDFLGRGPALQLPSEPGTVTVQVTGIGDLPLSASVGGYPAEVLSIANIDGQPGRAALKLRLPTGLDVGQATLLLEAGGAISQPGVLIRVP